MSYCRWSSDDHKSDVYCYAAADGYVTWVAGMRNVGDVPKLDVSSAEAMMRTHKAAMDYLETCEREPIGLPYDGEHFVDADLEDFLARLLHLREVGYHVPQTAIDTVREEIAEDPK